MKLSKRLFMAVLVPFVLIGLVPQAQAETWPSKPVRIIVPFGPGGTADVFTRLMAQHLQTALGQAVVIDNRPGGNFAIGTEAVAKSPADGYNLVLVTSSHTLVEALGVNRQKYQLMRDLTPVAALSNAQGVLVVHPSVPANSVKELIALAKSQPNKLNYGSSGTGSMLHLEAELFDSMAGTKMTHVPYKVGSGARIDLLAGRLQLMFDTLDGAAPYVRSGKLRALGTTGKTRSLALPDVPTLSEAGVPGYEVQVVIGLMAPAGTPKPVVDRLNAEINKIITRPDVREAWAKSDGQVLVMSPEELGKTLSAEVEKWTDLVKTANIKLD
ncbi:Tripartite-type tricarboxylate transporter, receptor component TctC [Polaromonas sp. OV174]|uniref:Bug family tripartite tricarboxylate transporter substrate binding protein n=1 Tax=Polaromonas sp. OV174 TaxID=1855300 RepID=UPI0008F273CA|nr:tripartite tricarboxylate transporter substrate binding protein [Polaromonas sp. OV174]SFB78366.1 Tripartite-type tricarboxylate transporter, receptor component TctC [Polaromonas sp. OV174]